MGVVDYEPVNGSLQDDEKILMSVCGGLRASMAWNGLNTKQLQHTTTGMSCSYTFASTSSPLTNLHMNIHYGP